MNNSTGTYRLDYAIFSLEVQKMVTIMPEWCSFFKVGGNNFDHVSVLCSGNRGISLFADDLPQIQVTSRLSCSLFSNVQYFQCLLAPRTTV